MLREVKNAAWVREGLLLRRYVFVTGNLRGTCRLRAAALAELEAAQRDRAVAVATGPRDRTYWWCLDRFYWEDEGLSADDVHALAYERRLRAQRKLERARATVAAAELPKGRRESIPSEVRRAVWERDGGRCVACDAQFDLQYDHVIPVALGGATTLDNLELLCGACNRAKGAGLG